MVGAEQFNELEKVTIEPKQILPLEDRSSITNNTYILGPGDGLIIELLDLPELSGSFTIGPDGTLFLPRLRAIYAEGLTVEELRNFLEEQFRTYVRDPQVFVQPVIYRPIRIYVGGEVKRPGYYMLGGSKTRCRNKIAERGKAKICLGVNGQGAGPFSSSQLLCQWRRLILKMMQRIKPMQVAQSTAIVASQQAWPVQALLKQGLGQLNSISTPTRVWGKRPINERQTISHGAETALVP